MNDFLKQKLEQQGYLPDEIRWYIDNSKDIIYLYNEWLREEIIDLQAEHNDARHGAKPDDAYDRVLNIIK